MTTTLPRRLNLGCGDNVLTGWENYDLSLSRKEFGVKYLDITKGLPFAEESIDYILIEHCLEHVSGPDAFMFMVSAHRVLKLNGILRICVPEITRVPKAKARDLICGHGHLMVYNLHNLVRMLEVAGFIFSVKTDRAECDGHWRVIGKELDDAETLRVEARK